MILPKSLFPLIPRIFLASLGLLLTGCSVLVQTNFAPAERVDSTVEPSAVAQLSVTPFQPLPTATITPTPPSIQVWLPEWIPTGIANVAELPAPFVFANSANPSDIQLVIREDIAATEADFTWVYALVAPFPTLTDNISVDEIQQIWSGAGDFPQQILLDESTLATFRQVWGEPNPQKVRVANRDDLLETAWSEKFTWAIVPFEEIAPRWKVIRIGGLSPLDRGLDLSAYPLTVKFKWEGQTSNGQATVSELRNAGIASTNRDEGKLTRVLLTGVTALVRSTAERMETMGIDYPIGDILPWLLDADFTHISNEVSFNDECPPAIPVRLGTRFCSAPKYVELLDLIDVEIIELTGNHLVDYGREALSSTLEMYRDRDILTYGGGANLNESLQPLVIEHNSNRIAFLGCNRAGPPNDWATEDQPGSAPCDLDLMTSQIQNLLDEGILPIVTFQHYELDDTMPSRQAQQEMQKMAEAGAVIVSGSQAHFPHGFAFFGDSFVHYGLGNLFFDQMYTFNRREFLDRHVFYNGRYLGVEILTAELEDFARPRPMTDDERTRMLTTYFEVSGWQINDRE
ncbi:MAG: CapA family protein [Bellilinea sp.]